LEPSDPRRRRAGERYTIFHLLLAETAETLGVFSCFVDSMGVD
jgi:hypothetical protein